MARKRLTKGTNALRVEERIARIPLDLPRPSAGDTGVFEALRILERKAGGEERPKAAKVDSQERPKAAAPKRAGGKRSTSPRIAADAPEGGAAPSRQLGPESFSRAERGAIVVSCTEYRNRLPTYLLSAQRELEIIDSILRKCMRAEHGAERGSDQEGDRGSAGDGGSKRT